MASAVGLTAMSALASNSKVRADCSFKAKRLYGRVPKANAFRGRP